MPIILTTSQAAGAASAATELVELIDFATASGEQHHVATQPCSYQGVFYAARLTGVSGVQGGAANVPYQLPAVKSLSFDLANDDGYWSRQRPGWLRGQPVTYREVFLDVDTPIRTFGFTVTNAAMPSEQTFHVEAEDVLAPVRRKLVPATDVLITDSLYPNLYRGGFQAGADGRNRPMPFLFGRTYTPLYFVDQSSDGSHIFAACVGSAYYVGSGSVVTWFDGGFSQIGGVDSATNDGGSTFPWSVRYAVRNTTRDDGSSFSMPVTEVVVHPRIAVAFDPIPRMFADLTWDHGSSAWTTPDEVLIEMFRNCFGGAHVTPTLLNSDSLLAAHSFYTANSIYFDGTLIEQRPFEDWLAHWQHDAMTRLVMRDQVHLVPCQSRTATFSLAAHNTLFGRTTYADVPLSQEFGRRTLYFKERTRDADYGPGDGGQGDARGGSFVRWDAGSGAEVALVSAFIGRPSVAGRVNRFWAEHQRAAQRIYRVPTTVKGVAIEEGDLGTFTNSHVGATAQLVDVYGVQRDGGLYDVTIAETAMSVFSIGVAAADPAFIPFYQLVPYRAGVQNVSPGVTVTLIYSHQLERTPTLVRPAGLFSMYISTSLMNGPNTNNSQAEVAHGTVTFTGPLNLQQFLSGWHTYV